MEGSKGSKSFGACIRAARTEAGISVESLAEKIDRYSGYIYRLERGEAPIHPLVLEELCTALPRVASHRNLAVVSTKGTPPRRLTSKLGAKLTKAPLSTVIALPAIGVAEPSEPVASEKPSVIHTVTAAMTVEELDRLEMQHLQQQGAFIQRMRAQAGRSITASNERLNGAAHH